MVELFALLEKYQEMKSIADNNKRISIAKMDKSGINFHMGQIDAYNNCIKVLQEFMYDSTILKKNYIGNN